MQGKHLTLSTAEMFGEGARAPPREAVRPLGGGRPSSPCSARARSTSSTCTGTAARAERCCRSGFPSGGRKRSCRSRSALMALVFAYKASDRWGGRVVAFLAIPAAFAIGLLPPEALTHIWPLALVVLAAALLGAPVFVAMGGIAAVLFFSEGTPVSAVTRKVYDLIGSPTLPAIPLLTAAGYVLAESAAAERLVRFFRVAVRLDAGRHRGDGGGGLRAVHDVHRRVGRDDHRARRPGLPDPPQGRLLRGLLAGPRDRLRVRSACCSRQACRSCSTRSSPARATRWCRSTSSTSPACCRGCCSSC